MIDPRPKCGFCGKRWVPGEGIDATVTFCGRCRATRRDSAARSFRAQDKRTVMVGAYVLRVAKNA